MYSSSKFLLILVLAWSVNADARNYPATMGEKLGVGLANAVTGITELPKTMALKTRQEGAAYGLTVGFATGLAHVLGRTLCGVFDLATFPVPTEALVRPDLIWKNFDRETTYNFKLRLR